MLANPTFSRKRIIAPQYIDRIIENDKKEGVTLVLGLHKLVNIIIRQNLQKKHFGLKKLEFMQEMKYSMGIWFL